MGSDPVKNALFTGFDIFYHVKNTESSQVFKKFFTGPFTGFFRGEKLIGFCMGSVLVKNALFTGSQQFHTLWKRCEKHVKLNSSQVFHSIFTCFYAPKNIKSLKCRRNSKVCSVVSFVSLLLSQCFLTLNRKIGVEKLIWDAIHECHESKGIHLVLCSASVYVHCASSVVNVENSSEDLPLTVKAKKNCHTIIAKLFEENHFRLFVTLRIRFTSFTRLVEWRRW